MEQVISQEVKNRYNRLYKERVVAYLQVIEAGKEYEQWTKQRIVDAKNGREVKNTHFYEDDCESEILSNINEDQEVTKTDNTRRKQVNWDEDKTQRFIRKYINRRYSKKMTSRFNVMEMADMMMHQENSDSDSD